MAQYTTSTTTYNIVKYSSCKVPLSAQIGASEIQWKHHQGERLRLALAVTTNRTPAQAGATGSGGESLARHVLRVSYLSDEAEETQNASQNANREVLFESLDLNSFSEVKYSGRELPLKAVHKNRSVAFRYLFPIIQESASPQTYRRFQVTFNTEEEALSFINSIQFVCPCSVARDQRPTETQASRPAPRPSAPAGIERRATAAPTRRTVMAASRPISSSQTSNPPLPRSATTYRKSTMFTDVLSSSSLGEIASSQSSGTRNGPPSSAGDTRSAPLQLPTADSAGEISAWTQDRLIDGEQSDRMEVDEPLERTAREADLSTDANSASHYRSRIAPTNIEQTSSPIQARQTQANALARVEATQPGAQVRFSGEEQRLQSSPSEIPGSAEHTRNGQPEVGSTELLAAIRQGDSDLYNLSFVELQGLVAEVIREPGFPELVGQVHKMWKERGLVEIQLAAMRE